MVVIPSLRLKLGLMKQFIKALDADDECFQCIATSFSALYLERVKAGKFDGPQIRALVRYHEFVRKMNEKKSELLSFKSVTQNCFGKRKAAVRLSLLGCWNLVNSSVKSSIVCLATLINSPRILKI
ncbi:hypothetical protein AVEN_226474-1 [Araneus ventricosus]|uniref:Uncharacterized protein n=1 Tax=Araneus ventricosus TaxID=182803 RepID=A0A4Y2E4L1_ARAVE|nr:hypothetical protein AVEN_226474-1 [Araneus ventricosus]